MITDVRLSQLTSLIQSGNEHDFYLWTEWKTIRRQVLRLDNWECQVCKSRHRHKRATIVHHVKHLKDRPDLALSIYDNGGRQLISVCKKCHEELHPEGQRQFTPKDPPITAERWD